MEERMKEKLVLVELQLRGAAAIYRREEKGEKGLACLACGLASSGGIAYFSILELGGKNGKREH